MKMEKLPSGSYRIRKMYKGVQYTVMFDTKPTQKEVLQAISAELDKAQVTKQRMTFKVAAEKYIDQKKNIISPSTVREYTGTIKRLSAEFTSMLISDVTAMDIQKEINLLSTNRAPKTVRNYHGFISAVLGTFCPNMTINTTMPKKHKVEPYIPTDEDVRQILEHSRGSIFEVAITLACFGLRRSEICALTMDDIEGNIIHINKALVMDNNKNWVIKSTKTEDGTRDIWVPDEVITLINSKQSIYSGSPNSITCYMTKLQDKLGITHFSLHKLRHYYASMSHALGIPDSYIMSSGGWKSGEVLRGIYRHAMKDKEQEMQQFAGEYLKEVIF